MASQGFKFYLDLDGLGQVVALPAPVGEPGLEVFIIRPLVPLVDVEVWQKSYKDSVDYFLRVCN